MVQNVPLVTKFLPSFDCGRQVNVLDLEMKDNCGPLTGVTGNAGGDTEECSDKHKGPKVC